MITPMLSLCCGAMPVGGVVRTYQTYQGDTIYHLGHCALCGQHAPFAKGGELETSPKWLRLPPLRPVKVPTTAEKLLVAQPDRQDRLFTFIGWVALAGWLAFITLGTWSALHRHRQGEGGQGAFKGSLQEQVGSSHAQQPAIKVQGGKQ